MSVGSSAQETPILEIAHVLFVDIVGYSKLAIDTQRHVLTQLGDLVRSSPRFAAAEADSRLVSLPTGDGMALVFFGDALSAVVAAVEVARSARDSLQVGIRMGIHSGPVYVVDDINGQRNVAGSGINIAQRVMDCGDSGHILLSQAIAEVLLQLEAWKDRVRFLGEAEVKHAVRLPIYSLCYGDLGTFTPPFKLRSQPGAASHRAIAWSLKRSALAAIQLVYVLPYLVGVIAMGTLGEELLTGRQGRGPLYVFAIMLFLALTGALLFIGLALLQRELMTFFVRWFALVYAFDLIGAFVLFALTVARGSVALGLPVLAVAAYLPFYQRSLVRQFLP